MNSTGFQGTASLCIAEEHETAFISTQGQSAEFMERGEEPLDLHIAHPGRELEFSSVTTLLENGVRWRARPLAWWLLTLPGQKESVERGLIDPLEAAGIEVAVNSAPYRLWWAN